MNTGKVIFKSLSILALVGFLSACTPATETPVASAAFVVKNIIENDLVIGQIEQKKSFDQCESGSSVSATIQFSETSGQTSQKALTLIGGGGVEVGLDKPAELKLEGAVQEYFSVTKQESHGTQESITIEVPARTRQEYTIIWREIRRTGTIEYLENGEPKFINFSYRTGVELAFSSVKSIDCDFPTETPIPTFTPPSTVTPPPPTKEPTATSTPRTIGENCIHSQNWKPASTDTNAISNISIQTDGCYSIEALGIFTDNAGVLHLNYRDQKKTIASGIYTSLKNNSVIEFKVFVNSMYIVYPEEPPVIVNFAVAPVDDPLTAKKAARFKLHVETNDNKPIIHFVMADANENIGTKVGSQHYEYGQTYTIRLELVGNSMKVFINGRKMNEDLLIPGGQKVFYIGYEIPVIAGVDIDISSVTIDGVPR